MAVVKNMMVRVGADFSGLIQQSQKALGATKSWASGTNSAFGVVQQAGAGLNRVLGALGIGLSVAGISAAINNVATLGDEIDKSSQKAGMSAEAYQEWDYVLQRCGTSMQAVQSSAKTLANAAQTYNDAFRRLGLSQQDVARMSQEELWETTIARLQQVTDTTERTYLATQLLGRGATELGAVLNMTGEETEALRARANALGGVFSNRATRNAAAFKDALTDTKSALRGVGNTVLESVVPSITLLINHGLIPIINGLSAVIAGAAKAANTFHGFLSALFGVSADNIATGTSAVEGFTGAAYDAADAAGSIGSAAADGANAAGRAAGSAAEKLKQLYSFDKMTRIQSNASGGGGGGGGSGGGGGGGGGGSGGGDMSSALGDTAFAVAADGGPLDTISQKLQDLASSLRLTFEDVFFEWGDKLNPENICEKVIVGLGALLGGATGFTIAGVPGAIVGTLVGVGLGIVFDSLVFNHDGVLSRSELGKSLSLALAGLAGAAVGFAVGGPGGALIGASIGAGIYIGLTALDWQSNGALANVLGDFTAACAILTGGGIGFAVGGPAGAAIGVAVGAGLSIVLEELAFGTTEGWSAGDWLKKIVETLGKAAINGLSFVVGGPMGEALRLSLTAGLDLLFGDVDFGTGSASNLPTLSVGVDLVKQGWETVTGWLGTTPNLGNNGNPLGAGVSLVRDGFESVYEWIKSKHLGTSAVSKGVALEKSGFESVADWIKNSHMGSDISKGISLAKSGFESVADWIKNSHMGSDISKGVSLAKSGWDTIHGWLSKDDNKGGPVSHAVGLIKSGWSTVQSWIGTDSNKGKSAVAGLVSLKRDGWSTVQGWVKNYLGKSTVNAPVGLKKSGWTSVYKYLSNNMGSTIKAGVKIYAQNRLSTSDIIKPGSIKVYDSSGSSAGTWRAVPQARGGIVNAATLLGPYLVGEAGREAIVPLENNTEWTGQVARLMMQAMGREGGGSAQNINLTVNLDGETVYRTVIRRGQQDAARGSYPLAALV